MKAKELLDSGHLDGAVAEINEEIKKRPSDTRLRTFLFELLCFTGDLSRAEKQLDVVGHQSDSASIGIGVEVYRSNLRAETLRRRAFLNGQPPEFPFTIPSHIQLHLDALVQLSGGNTPEARKLLQRAAEARPRLGGRCGDKPFQDFRDYDDVLAPVLEVISKDKYLWFPFEQIKKITVDKPKFLRDLIWVPATIQAHEGATGQVFIPVLYAGSHEDADDKVRLGRMTEWKSPGEGIACGIGQRTFLIDEDERGLLEVQDIEFEPASTPN